MDTQLPVSPPLQSLLEEGPPVSSGWFNWTRGADVLDPNGIYWMLAHRSTHQRLVFVLKTLKALPSSPIVESHIRKFTLYLESYDIHRQIVDFLDHDQSSARSAEEARGVTACTRNKSTEAAYQRWIHTLFEACSAIE